MNKIQKIRRDYQKDLWKDKFREADIDERRLSEQANKKTTG